ncbi:MAG: ferrochelatase [Acidobacteriota bacterium]|nr:ferrochelatase [Acidobacteriota bacterium]
MYDALLIVSFGGPERPEEVIPFLENVLRGRKIPRERMLEVAEHYYHFGGKSPINDQNRSLIAALRDKTALPVYWGNRNWHPFLKETIGQMRNDGIRRALAFVTSAYSSYSGCRQYRENIEAARGEAGEGAPEIDKLRVFYNHPGFIEPMVENVRAALSRMPGATVVYTAHSIPLAMAESSCYEAQLREACRLVSAGLGRHDAELVFQSRSGAPGQPWLEPDIGEYIRNTSAKQLVIVPVGFISDHMEVLFDLDTEVRRICQERGIRMERAPTVGAHPAFIAMIAELIAERTAGIPRRALGALGANHDFCPAECCPGPPSKVQ